jgi:LppP/LprE lipoprotein
MRATLASVIATAAAVVLTAVATAVAGPAPRSVIRAAMKHTFENGSFNSDNFMPAGPRLTIPDGAGGTITAQSGLRTDSADAHGWVVFFFQNNRFLGWDSVYESLTSALTSNVGHRFAVRYRVYRSTDPLCCPSLPDVVVHYRWDGHRIRMSRPIPHGARGDRLVFR